jgi:hypothetical protein
MPYQLPDFAGGIAQMFAMGQQVAAQNRQNKLLELQQQQAQEQRALTQAEQQYQIGNVAPLQNAAPWRFQQLEQAKQAQAATLAKNKAVFDVRANPNLTPEQKIAALEQIDPDAGMQLRKDLAGLAPQGPKYDAGDYDALRLLGRYPATPEGLAQAQAEEPERLARARMRVGEFSLTRGQPPGTPQTAPGNVALAPRQLGKVQMQVDQLRDAISGIDEMMQVSGSNPGQYMTIGGDISALGEAVSGGSDPVRAQVKTILDELNANSEAVMPADEFGGAEKVRSYNLSTLGKLKSAKAFNDTLAAKRSQMTQDLQRLEGYLFGGGMAATPQQPPQAKPQQPMGDADLLAALKARMVAQGKTADEILAAARAMGLVK